MRRVHALARVDILDEVARLGSNVLVIAKGRLAAQGDFHAIRELLDDRPRRVRVRTDKPQLLDLPSGAAAFSLERLGTRDGKPVEWRTTLIRGDRYRFVSEWSPDGGGSMLRPSA